jgi:hypothetical protein
LTHVIKRADGNADRDDHDQQQQEQQHAVGPIIGPTMMIMMVLPVLSLTVEWICNRVDGRRSR